MDDVRNFNYSGFWKRLVAAIIDGVIASLIGFAAMMPIYHGLDANEYEDRAKLVTDYYFYGSQVSLNTVLLLDAVMLILLILAVWLYFAILESSSMQGSLGKLMLNMKVTDSEGARTSFGKASVRHFGKILSALILLIGFVMAAFTKRKQALHDILAGCLVLNK